jgi:thymidylate kinase
MGLYQGLFIVIEGGDASGKTTLVENLQSQIKRNSNPFKKDEIVFLKSPTQPFSDVWKLLISHKNITPLTRFKLFHTIAYNDSEVARQLLTAGKNVILERYLYSTEAFNHTLDNFHNISDPDHRSENHISYRGLLQPDLGFLLDVSDDKRIERLYERFKSNGMSPWEESEFQIPLNVKLREIAQRENLMSIDTDILSKTQVVNIVTNKILEFTELRR